MEKTRTFVEKDCICIRQYDAEFDNKKDLTPEEAVKLIEEILSGS